MCWYNPVDDMNLDVDLREAIYRLQDEWLERQLDRLSVFKKPEFARGVNPFIAFRLLADGFTLREIGAAYGISAERVRQLSIAAAYKIRRALPEYWIMETHYGFERLTGGEHETDFR
jgi:hypothetical protein